MIGADIAEGIAGRPSDKPAVHGNAIDSVAGCRGKGISFTAAEIQDRNPLIGDGSSRAVDRRRYLVAVRSRRIGLSCGRARYIEHGRDCRRLFHRSDANPRSAASAPRPARKHRSGLSRRRVTHHGALIDGRRARRTDVSPAVNPTSRYSARPGAGFENRQRVLRRPDHLADLVGVGTFRPR